MKPPSESKGFAIIEVIISMLIASALITTFQALILGITKNNIANKNQLQATMYLKEAIEATKDISQSDIPQSNWATLDTCGANCHPVIKDDVPGTYYWSLDVGSGPLLDNKFARYLTISKVKRNASGAIDGNGTDDPNTRKVTATLTWRDGGNPNTIPHTISTEALLYNF